jgi:hypothetical protein
MPADLTRARAAARLAKETASAKIIDARREAAARKALKAAPPKQYVQMPEPTGDAEADSVADLDAVQSGFRSRAKDDASRKALATDTEFWACLCFQTRAQKDAFLAALKIAHLGDKYIDGQEVADVLGVTIPQDRPPYHAKSKVDPVWAGFVD